MAGDSHCSVLTVGPNMEAEQKNTQELTAVDQDKEGKDNKHPILDQVRTRTHTGLSLLILNQCEGSYSQTETQYPSTDTHAHTHTHTHI